MTLYWWMHWFWITTLKLQVLVSVFLWTPLVHSASLPLAPVVQNGHQNGPYFNELSIEHIVSTPPSQQSTNSEQSTHYSIKDATTSEHDVHEDLTPPQPTHVDSLIITSDHEQTESPADLEDSTEDQKEATIIANAGNHYKDVSSKNTFIPSLDTPKNSRPTIGTFLHPDTNDNEDSTYILPHNGPVIEGSRSKGRSSEESKIIWIDKLSAKILGIHDKSTSVELSEENVGKDTIPEEVPMSDGPYNPTGSFINSTNIRVKTVLSTLKTPEMSTARESILTDEKTEEERKEKSLNNVTTTEATTFYVTPNTVTDNSENSKNMDHATENLNSSNNNISVNSTENIFEDDYNSTFAMGGNTTFVAKTDIISPETPLKNKSQGNSIRVISFDHSNIEESTKVSSGVVQTVIDESINSTGQTWSGLVITGCVLGVFAIVGLIGAASCVIYRRRYLNNPQTLNDKCSNPDSSGYIDDSTLRENSEEMYSLDNDSFLNSLEAMTIQNYWTDNVKHTKL